MKILTTIFNLLLFSCFTTLFASEWENLLDENLSKWEIYMGVPHPSVQLPEGMDAKLMHNNKTPLGLNKDPLNVFQIQKQGEETVLKISGEIYAGLTSLKEYENYHFKCQYKWGEKKYEPRLNRKRDSGILFHAVGKHGSFGKVWKTSLECQVQENDTGDFIGLAGTNADIYIERYPNLKRGKFSFDGVLHHSTGYTDHAENYDHPHGEWNTVEVLTIEQTSIFLVNSKPNMVLYNSVYRSKGKYLPLSKGQIQIQSEGAEVYYKDIKIKMIDEFPESLLQYIKQPTTLAKNFRKK